jgi:hypothetical protein
VCGKYWGCIFDPSEAAKGEMPEGGREKATTELGADNRGYRIDIA